MKNLSIFLLLLAHATLAQAGSLSSDTPLKSLSFLSNADVSGDYFLNLEENMSIGPGVDRMSLSKDSWTCFAKLHGKYASDYVLHSGQFPLIDYSDTIATEVKAREFYWQFGSDFSGFVDIEKRHEIVFAVRDPTLWEVKCISPVDSDNVGGLFEAMKPFSLTPSELPTIKIEK